MITIVLVDDQPSVLEALQQYFALEPDLCIVGKAKDAAEALDLVMRLQPDVVLLDFQMPGIDGIAAAAALRGAAPRTRVVILTIHDNRSVRARAHAAGVTSFVGKHDGAEVLLAVVRGSAPRCANY
ncbi:MAG: response regulator transcription factor [Chloroflexia bacterium]